MWVWAGSPDVCYNTIVLRTGILLSERTKAMDTRPYMIRLTEGEFVKLAELSRRTGLKRALVVKRLIAEASENAKPVQFLRATGGGDD